MSYLTNALTAGLVALAPTFAFAHEGWVADFDEAVAQAKAEGKDLFVDFTGSDWCGWCIKLNEEVFDHDEFNAYATEHFVLVALDFPSGEAAKAKVPNPERNDELQEQYGITGFPTILLMNTDGEVYGRTGYRAGGPAPYVEYLQELRAEGKAALAAAKEHVARWEAATDENRMEVLGSILTEFEGLAADSVAVAMLSPIVARAMELDADNAKGLKLRAVKALLAAGETSEELIASATELDPKNEQGLFEHVVLARCNAVASIEDLAEAVEAIRKVDELGIQDKSVAEELYGNAAFWSWKYLDQKEDAVAFANKCLALEPGNPNLTMMLNDLLGELAPEETPEETPEVEQG